MNNNDFASLLLSAKKEYNAFASWLLSAEKEYDAFASWLLSAEKEYDAAIQLMKDSENDPPNEPYRSKYKAREIFIAQVTEIETRWNTVENLDLTILHGGLLSVLGLIALETDELSEASNFLTSSWEKIKDSSGKPENCEIALNVLNLLGFLWRRKDDPQKELSFLDEAVKLYNTFKANYSPNYLRDVFDAQEEEEYDWSYFEKLYTNTLYYLAQVYGRLNDSDKEVKYYHQALKRQIDSGDFEANDWALRCARLATRYSENKMFIVARHLLACATNVLNKSESKLNEHNNGNRDELCKYKAEVSFCWLKCINLLLESQISLPDKESINQEVEVRLSNERDVLLIEEQVPFTVSSFEEAKAVFLFGQNKVNEAKLFFTLNRHAINHVDVVQDHCNLYRFLACYEEDLSRKCKMYRRCINMLEAVLAKLNPQYYLPECRQLQCELGKIYSEMVDLKYKIIKSETQSMSVHNVKKINSLIMQGIGHFNTFIDSLKDHDGTLPSVFTDDLVKAALIVHFELGNLYSKCVEFENNKIMFHLLKSEEHYKFVLDYIERNPFHANYVENELPLIKEMVQLRSERILKVSIFPDPII